MNYKEKFKLQNPNSKYCFLNFELLLALFFLPCFVLQAQLIRSGAERTSEYMALLKNKRVAIVANQSSLIGNRHLVDTLLHNGVNILCLLYTSPSPRDGL